MYLSMLSLGLHTQLMLKKVDYKDIELTFTYFYIEDFIPVHH